MTTVSIAEAVQLAKGQFEAGKLDGANDICLRILATDPNNLDALRLTLLISIKQGRHEATAQLAVRSYSAFSAHLGKEQFAAAAKVQEEARQRLIEAHGLYQRAAAYDPARINIGGNLWEIERAIGQKPAYFSQHGQDEYIHQTFFKDKRGGVFVDVGAYDGVNGSNTAFFEKFLGWTGLCIEPAPTQYEALIGYRSAVCLRTSVADFDGEADFFHVTDGLTMMGGLVQSFDEKAMKSIGDRSKKSETIKVPVRRLSKILEEHRIEEIDYCSIDTEGSELMILRDLDLSRLRITVLTVENNSNTNEVRDYLATFGYSFTKRLGYDDIFHRA